MISICLTNFPIFLQRMFGVLRSTSAISYLLELVIFIYLVIVPKWKFLYERRVCSFNTLNITFSLSVPDFFWVCVTKHIFFFFILNPFVFERTYQLFLAKLSCSTEHFTRSENNLTLLHLCVLLCIMSTCSDLQACLMETRDCCKPIMMGYVSINPKLCLCTWALTT